MRRIVLTYCLILTAAVHCQAQDEPNQADPKQDKGRPAISWIWKSKTPVESERVLFRREFELPPNVESAVISLVCDDWHHIFINGVDLGSAGGWTTWRNYDVLAHLKQDGRNVIAVEAKNEKGAAALALRFRATLKDGKKLLVVSDATWICSSEAPDGWRSLDFPTELWPKAVVVGKMGDPPWGLVIPAEVEPVPGAELTVSPMPDPAAK
jgi:hypothetical protein